MNIKKISLSLLCLVLISGCTSTDSKDGLVTTISEENKVTTAKTTTNTSDKIVTDVTKPVVTEPDITESVDFSITELKLEFPEKVNDKDCSYEYRSVFNNKLNFTLLCDKPNNKIYTKQILTYDLSNGKVDVFKEFNDKQRIWSFIVINENEWIYSTSKADTETAFVRFEVIHETLNNKEILVSGLAWSDYDVPSLVALDNQIYFPVRNYIPSSDPLNGEFIAQVWKFDEDGANIILNEKGKYVNNKVTKDTMAFNFIDLDISDNTVNFITCNASKCISYSYKNNTLNSFESDQQLYYLLNLDDFKFLTYKNKKTNKINSVIFNKSNEFTDTNFNGSFNCPTALDKNTFIGIISEEDKLILVQVNKKGVVSKTPVYTKDDYIYAIRQISDEEALLLGQKKNYIFSLVENQSN